MFAIASTSMDYGHPLRDDGSRHVPKLNDVSNRKAWFHWKSERISNGFNNFLQSEWSFPGVSGAFLADIKPQTDGCNGLKYNLTADIIECIFKTYPAVKRKHSEHVPAKLTESEFWTKFFQSHYFHRDRIMAGTKDLFTECGKIDDQALKSAVAQSASGDALLDLRSFEDNSLEEGFGGAATDKHGVNSGNIVHQNMIKRFNQHSTMVLNTCLKTADVHNGKTEASPMQAVPKHSSTNGLKESHHKRNHIAENVPPMNTTDAEPKNKFARIAEKIRYDDLESDADDSCNGAGQTNASGKSNSQLNLVKVERYLHGPVPLTNYNDSNEEINSLETTQFHILKCIDTWNTRTPQKVLVNSSAAVNALGELSPGGALMRGFQEQSLARKFDHPVNGLERIQAFSLRIFLNRTSASECWKRTEKFIFGTERIAAAFLAFIPTDNARARNESGSHARSHTEIWGGQTASVWGKCRLSVFLPSTPFWTAFALIAGTCHEGTVTIGLIAHTTPATTPTDIQPKVSAVAREKTASTQIASEVHPTIDSGLGQRTWLASGTRQTSATIQQLTRIDLAPLNPQMQFKN